MEKTLFIYFILLMFISSGFGLVLKTNHKDQLKNPENKEKSEDKQLQEKLKQNSDKKQNQTLRIQVKKQVEANPQLSWYKTLQPETQNQFIDIMIDNINEKPQNRSDVFINVLKNKKMGPIVAEKIWKSQKGIDESKVKDVKKEFPQYKDLDFNNIPTKKKIEIILKLNESGWLKKKKQK